MLRTLEILFLTMDPTEGFLSMGFIYLLAQVHRLLLAAYSRENERQADELGIQIAARACFDTAVGCHVLHKMHDWSVSAAPDPDSMPQWQWAATRLLVPPWLDTHPPTLERWERVQVLSATENYTKYAHAQCANTTRRIFGALGGSWGKPQSHRPNNNSTNNTAKKK